MDVTVKEIALVLLLLLAPQCVCKVNQCIDENNLDQTAERKLQHHYPQRLYPSRGDEPDSPPHCPVRQFKAEASSLDASSRSLSPWRYVKKSAPDHYPSTYYEAQCLCSGCIMFGKEGPYENFDYNSYPVMQSRVFLKKELCDDGTQGRRYHLKPESRNVVVGCTCVRPNRIRTDE